MVKLIPVQKPDQILPKYRNTPIERLFLYHNLKETLPPTSVHAELLIGLCMDNRKDLIIPNEFAYIIRGAGANTPPTAIAYDISNSLPCIFAPAPLIM